MILSGHVLFLFFFLVFLMYLPDVDYLEGTGPE